MDENATVVNIGNGYDGVKAMEEETDPTEKWDLSKVYVYTDPTGIKVPVPIGFTVSGADSEKYVTGNVEKEGMLTNLIFTSSGDYPWTQNDSNIWISGNVGQASSESELVSNEITVGDNGGYVSVEWSVCSQSGYDLLSMTVTDTVNGTSEMLKEITGTSYGTTESSLIYAKFGKELETGKYIVTIKYTKNASGNSGLDRGYVKGGTFLNYDHTGTNIQTVHKTGGLVIYEGTDPITDANAWNESLVRNQFVWVPVADTSRIYVTNELTRKKKAKLWNFTASGRSVITGSSFGYGDIQKEPGILENVDNLRNLSKYSLVGYTQDTLYKELQSEFDRTMESIERYGGFYIGRYETGNLQSYNIVIRRLNRSINFENWYNIYSKVRNMSSNQNIKINIIWGCLWDETLEWLIESQDKTRIEIAGDSSNWGNYKNVEFSYNDGTQVSIKKSGTNNNISIPTGSAERNKANNIYDLAGNVNEWTLERNRATLRSVHGGNYGYDGDRELVIKRESSYWYDDYPTTSRTMGVRLYLYIK